MKNLLTSIQRAVTLDQAVADEQRIATHEKVVQNFGVLTKSEVHDFVDAMRAYKSQAEWELSVLGPTESYEKRGIHAESLLKINRDSIIALDVYNSHFSKLKKAVVKELHGKNLHEIADAFENDDYSGLAI